MFDSQVFWDSTVIAAMSFLLLESPSRYQGNILALCKFSILMGSQHTCEAPGFESEWEWYNLTCG